MLAPILPATASKVAREFFGLGRDFEWADALVAPTRVAAYAHLMTRIDPKRIDALLDGPTSAGAPPQPPSSAGGSGPVDGATHISIDDFSKVDLRIARIVHAEAVSGADKLLKLTLDVGEDRHRTVFAGIKSAYSRKISSGA